MLKFIDNQLNRITMYRLVLYYLIVLFASAVYMSSAHLLNMDPFALCFSLALLLAVSWITNRLFAYVYAVPTNVESVYISALILALIITPPQTSSDYWFLAWAGVLAMASKYIVAYKGKHLFNPIAFAVMLTYFATNQSASWWIGNPILLPVVLVGGFLVVRKIGRFDLVLSFLISTILFTAISIPFTGENPLTTFQNLFLYSPILFFASLILTEPLTTPPTHRLRIIYGILIGFLFIPQLHFASFYLTPEIAILIGNIYSFIVSPKEKLHLRLKDKTKLASDIYEFTFSAPGKMNFKPGQYMEWTFGHPSPDSRGNRRYFTLASSPSENLIKLGIKFADKPSTYKSNLLAMKKGDEIIASQLEGDFVLPANRTQKCVLIAGGVGITPFRSMLKYLLDTRQRRPITVLYAAHSPDDIIYKDVLTRAEQELGIKTIYLINNARDKTIPSASRARNPDAVIQQNVSNYRFCLYYLSGSRSMVEGFKESLLRIGVPASHIKTDFFAGLA
jgi:ferredoxin-NADP reductase